VLRFCRICGESVDDFDMNDGMCPDCQNKNLIKAKVVVTALVNVDNEVKEKAKEQYMVVKEENIAQNMLVISTINGLDNINLKDHYWDGVANLKGSIIKVDVDFLEER